MTSRLTLALHVVGMLARHERLDRAWTTSAELAESITTHPVVVKRLLADLGEAGIVESKRGPGGGTRLARAAGTVRLVEVFDAVRVGETLFDLYPNGPSDTCVVAPHLERYVRELYADAEERVRSALAARSVADMETEVSARVEGAYRCGKPIHQKVAPLDNLTA